jgi:hypothetical protein
MRCAHATALFTVAGPVKRSLCMYYQLSCPSVISLPQPGPLLAIEQLNL